MKLGYLILFAASAKALPFSSEVETTNITTTNHDEVITMTENVNFTSLAITVVQSSAEAYDHSGMIYIQETGELCSDDEPVKSKDVDFTTLMNAEDIDIQKVPKAGKKKYCVSKIENLRRVSKRDLTAPISPCLDSSAGDGGSIGKSISVSLSLTGLISPGLAMPLFNLISVSGGITAAASVGLSFSYSCTAAAGDSIQMWLTPLIGVTNFQYRTYHKWNGQKHSYSDYKNVKNFEFPVGGAQPAIQCFKGEFVDCGKLVTTNFKIPVKGL